MLEQIIDRDETILWRGRPNRLAYSLSNPFAYLFGLGWALFYFFFFSRFFTGMASFHSQANFPDHPMDGGIFSFLTSDLFRLIPTIIFAIPLVVIFLGPVYRFIAWSKVEYAVTNRQCYMLKGLVGRDITSVNLKTLRNLAVDVSLLDRMLGTGTIRLTPDQYYGTGDNRTTIYGYRFQNISDPYAVYQLIKEQNLKFSRDENYPDAMRPGFN